MAEYKEKYNAKVVKNGTNYSSKRKKFASATPKEGYISKAVWEFYSDLKDRKQGDLDFLKVW